VSGYEYALVIVLYLLVGCALGMISKLRQRVGELKNPKAEDKPEDESVHALFAKLRDRVAALEKMNVKDQAIDLPGFHQNDIDKF
jgi:hypothetical protein